MKRPPQRKEPPSLRPAPPSAAWTELGEGAPTVIALAHLCSEALIANASPQDPLMPEARALLFASGKRGVMEIQGSYQEFDSIQRLLAVAVDLDGERMLVFRSSDDPLVTMRFMEAFTQLCRSGLIMHHLVREFSLTRAGFELARSIDEAEVRDLLAKVGQESGARSQGCGLSCGGDGCRC